MIVKVCGMREPDNIRAVEQTGPDWMGFIFFPHSSRHVSLRPAYLPERCKRVGRHPTKSGRIRPSLYPTARNRNFRTMSQPETCRTGGYQSVPYCLNE